MATGTTNSGLRDLYDACCDRDIPRIKALLSEGVSPNGKVPRLAGDTLLHAPIIQMNSDIAELLIEAGAELDARAAHGRTPLMAAVFNGDRILKLLIEKGASLELKDDEGQTALDLANMCRPESAEIIRNAIERPLIEEKAAREAEQKKIEACHNTAAKRQQRLKNLRAHKPRPS